MNGELVVLYIEDNADIREVTEFALEHEGFTLVSCANGQDALDKAPELRPDLILLDVVMPGLDGPTTLQKLREFPHLAETPAIFMTAIIQPVEIEQLLAMGARGVIGKPFDPLTLNNEIRTLIQGDYG